jgi:hypothetical protein
MYKFIGKADYAARRETPAGRIFRKAAGREIPQSDWTY